MTDCWSTTEVCAQMNAFLAQVRRENLQFYHMEVFQRLLEKTDCKGEKVIDLGCGTAHISEHCTAYQYAGADLPHILAGCAKEHFPQYYYRGCDITTDTLEWIREYPVTIVNGVVDVMQEPLKLFEQVLRHAGEYVLLHRQEVSAARATQSIQKSSYGGKTWHSIINRKDLDCLLDRTEFGIIVEEQLDFADWEDNGRSFLLRRRKSRALHELDFKLNKYFEGVHNGFFIEAGANDGLRQSNSYYFEFYKNWRGLLVEPVRALAERCAGNRSPNTIVECCALVAADYGKQEVELLHFPDCHGLLSVINEKKLVKTQRRKTPEPGKKETTAARTLDALLNKHAAIHQGQIQFLSLDIEGYELQALQGISFDIWNIQYLLIEELTESEAVQNYLAPWYAYVEDLSPQDRLYKRI